MKEVRKRDCSFGNVKRRSGQWQVAVIVSSSDWQVGCSVSKMSEL